MFRILAIVVLLAGSLAGCGSIGLATPGPPTDTQQKADIYDIEQIEANWHKASSTKDLDLMMSLWADNATFQVGTQTYTGKDQIRNFFATQASPFKPENQWISETPAYKMTATVNGDKGTLYFECHYVDVPTKTVKSVVAANQDVARINGKWVITSSIAASPTLTP